MADIDIDLQGTDGSEGSEDTDQNTDLDNKGEGDGSQDAGEGSDDKGDDKSLTVEEQLAQRDSENQELRSLLRDGKRSIEALTQRIDASDAALDKAGLITEEEKKAAADQQVEFDSRKRELDNILEVTRLSAKFEDVDTVVSQANFDFVIDAMSKDYAVQNGLSQDQAVEAVEGWVWSLINPYRYMYGKVKELHPNFRTAGRSDKGEKGGKGSSNAPGSIQEPSGGSSDAHLTGWTAAKIDALPESELNSVPKDVYAKYLQNELK